MNKSIVAALCTIVILAACRGNKGVPTDSVEEGTEAADTDSVTTEVTLPVAAENLFDDFLYYFATDSRLQQARIQITKGDNGNGNSSTADDTEWQTEHFFMDGNDYAQLFDSPEQMDLVSDTTINKATVEKIFLMKDSVVQFTFNRIEGHWMMTAMKQQTVSENSNAAFLTFYRQFVNDSTFQQKSLSEQIEFTATDPDGDFDEKTEGVITPEFWSGFAPEMPKDLIYNIVYGHDRGHSQQKILVLRNMNSDWETEITFSKERGKWMLTKLNE